MTLALRIVGVLLLLMGTVWFLQGLSILGGGFMVGQTRWVVYEAIAAVVGVDPRGRVETTRPLPSARDESKSRVRVDITGWWGDDDGWSVPCS